MNTITTPLSYAALLILLHYELDMLYSLMNYNRSVSAFLSISLHVYCLVYNPPPLPLATPSLPPSPPPPLLSLSFSLSLTHTCAYTNTVHKFINQLLILSVTYVMFLQYFKTSLWNSTESYPLAPPGATWGWSTSADFSGHILMIMHIIICFFFLVG